MHPSTLASVGADELRPLTQTLPFPLRLAEDDESAPPVVFCAHAVETAYLKERICAFVLARGAVPINPYMALPYLVGLGSREQFRDANRALIGRCDEVWVFGPPMADGLLSEIHHSGSSDKPLRYFSLDHYGEQIIEVDDLMAMCWSDVGDGLTGENA